jgi:uncharacterized protein YukJ
LLAGLSFTIGGAPSLTLTLLSSNGVQLQDFLKEMSKLPIMGTFDKKRFKPVQFKDKGSCAHVNSCIDLLKQKIVAIRCFRKHKVIRKGRYTVSSA